MLYPVDHKERLNLQSSSTVFCHLEGGHRGIYLISLDHQTGRCSVWASHPGNLLPGLWRERERGSLEGPVLSLLVHMPILGWYGLLSRGTQPFPHYTLNLYSRQDTLCFVSWIKWNGCHPVSWQQGQAFILYIDQLLESTEYV